MNLRNTAMKCLNLVTNGCFRQKHKNDVVQPREGGAHCRVDLLRVDPIVYSNAFNEGALLSELGKCNIKVAISCWSGTIAKKQPKRSRVVIERNGLHTRPPQ
jgi:hypothetical protein